MHFGLDHRPFKDQNYQVKDCLSKLGPPPHLCGGTGALLCTKVIQNTTSLQLGSGCQCSHLLCCRTEGRLEARGAHAEPDGKQTKVIWKLEHSINF